MLMMRRRRRGNKRRGNRSAYTSLNPRPADDEQPAVGWYLMDAGSDVRCMLDVCWMYIVYCLSGPDDEDHSGEGEGEDSSEDNSALMIYEAEYWSLVCEGIEKQAGDEEAID